MDEKRDGADRCVEEVFHEYGNMLYRIAFVMMKNAFDAEDIVQDTLIKYMECRRRFDTEEYRKAWLIRVTINLCKSKQEETVCAGARGGSGSLYADWSVVVWRRTEPDGGRVCGLCGHGGEWLAEA